jgi:hypothetical protein
MIDARGRLTLVRILVFLVICEVHVTRPGLDAVDASAIGDGPDLVLRDGPVSPEDDAALPPGALGAVEIDLNAESDTPMPVR